ncbi:MAG: class I SAM-dependent methyltransferase [Reyranella sp.]|uniref:class I SAM-dependent methyltransferase n=1 Tax=Reyranella sp. TaxID=1929291 RepID=UPI003D09B437
MTSPTITPQLDLDSEQLARAYERESATRQFESGKRLVGDLALVPGERVLDVGCGTGRLAEHIADIVGPSGSVLGIDPLVERIAIARGRSRAHLAFEVGDARDLGGLSDASFDAVLLNAVFHWLPDKAGPLASFIRVLRPGGRLGLTTWPPGQRTMLQQARLEVLAEPPFDRHVRPADGVLFRVDEDRMRALLGQAGFTDIRIELRPAEQTFADAEAAIRYSEASAFGNFLGHLPVELRARAREEIRRQLQAKVGDQPVVRREHRMVVFARKPEGA